MKKKIRALVALMVTGMALIAAFVTIRVSGLTKIVEVEEKKAIAYLQSAMELDQSMAAIESVFGILFSTTSNEVAEPQARILAEKIQELKSSLEGLKTASSDLDQDAKIGVTLEDETKELTRQDAIKGVETSLPVFTALAQAAMTNRIEQLKAFSEMEASRKELSQLYRSNSNLQSLGAAFWTPYSRAVITVLSSSSLKDIAYAGRAVFADAQERFDKSTASTAMKAQMQSIKSVFDRARESSTRYFSGADDFVSLKRESAVLGHYVGTLSVDSKQHLSRIVDKVASTALGLSVSVVVTSVLVIILGLVVGFLTAKSLIDESNRVITGMQEVSGSVTSTSSQLADLSAQLANASTTSAAAVQESVSSMTQINSMLIQSSESLTSTVTLSKNVLERSDAGIATMDDMSHSMEYISSSAKRLGEIKQIIADIEAKTGVIDDVVFKTQLLAVNAAIEAARAGQYGKGFAVVANEVAGLASLSGKAANEINDLIVSSNKKVEQIIAETGQSVVKGEQATVHSTGAFKQITAAIKEMNAQLANTAAAISEIKAGVSQTAVALKQMNESSSNTSRLAIDNAAIAETLQEQANDLTEIGVDLRDMASGENEKLIGFDQVAELGNIVVSWTLTNGSRTLSQIQKKKDLRTQTAPIEGLPQKKADSHRKAG